MHNPHLGTSEPTDNGDDSNTNDKGKVTLVGKKGSSDEQTKNTNPDRGTSHGGSLNIITSITSSWDTIETSIGETGFCKSDQGDTVCFGTSSQGDGSGNVTYDYSNTFGRLQPKMGQKGTNGGGSGSLDWFGNELGDKVTDSGQGKKEKDKPFNEDSGRGGFKGNLSSSVEPNDTKADILCVLVFL